MCSPNYNTPNCTSCVNGQTFPETCRDCADKATPEKPYPNHTPKHA
jgi:hypothetical protein